MRSLEAGCRRSGCSSTTQRQQGKRRGKDSARVSNHFRMSRADCMRRLRGTETLLQLQKNVSVTAARQALGWVGGL